MKGDATEQDIIQIWPKRITIEGYHLKAIKKGLISYHFLFSLPDVVRLDEFDTILSTHAMQFEDCCKRDIVLHSGEAVANLVWRMDSYC